MYVCVPYCESVYNLLEQNHLQKTEIDNHHREQNNIAGLHGAARSVKSNTPILTENARQCKQLVKSLSCVLMECFWGGT